VVLGDNWCRFYVRMMEVVQAIRLVRQAIPKYKAATGSYREPFKLNAKLPKDEVYLETECPRGQMGFYVVGNGDGNPLRVRAKSSLFLQPVHHRQICQGVPLADIPAIVGSLDIVMGEIDR
jgi:NADH-quinone oxidoreductase subunit D